MCKPVVTREGKDIRIRHASKGSVVFARNDAVYTAQAILIAAANEAGEGGQFDRPSTGREGAG